MAYLSGVDEVHVQSVQSFEEGWRHIKMGSNAGQTLIGSYL